MEDRQRDRSDARQFGDAGSVPAIVLAAGHGTRLYPLTAQLAKPAIPFLDRPLIHYSLDLLQEGGVRHICVNLHHRPESVRGAVDAWAPPETDIHYSWEEEILGTGGAFARAAPFLNTADCFVAVNGKIYFEQKLRPVLQAHRQSEALVTMVVVPHTGAEPFNPVLLDEQHRVERFALRNEVGDFSNAFVYTGLQIVSSQLLESIPNGYCNTVQDLYPGLLERGQIKAFVSSQFWCENSTPERYLENVFRVARRKTTQGFEGEPKVIHGARFQPGQGSHLSQVIAWDDVSVGDRTRLHRAILSRGCRVPPDQDLNDVVLTPPDIESPKSGTGILPVARSRQAPISIGTCLAWPLESAPEGLREEAR